MASPDSVRRPWADLPCEILRFTADLLDLVSCIHCRAVCSAWATAFSGERTPHPPLLLFTPVPMDGKATNYKLFDISNSKSHQIHVSKPSLTSRRHLFCVWVGSNEGWFVRKDSSYDHYLLNPLTGAQIHLPFDFYCHSHRKIIICHTPNHKNGFLLLSVLSSSGGLAFLKAGDKGWTLLGVEKSFKDAIFYNGKVYALNSQGHLYTWDLSTSAPSLEKVIFNTVQSYELLKLVDSRGKEIKSSSNEGSYLVESGSKLLMVFRERVSHSPGNSAISTEEDIVRVLKFDPVRAECSLVCSLDNFALFLDGYSTGYSIPVSSHSTHGFSGNCVYFIERTWRQIEEGKWVHSCVEEFNLGGGTGRIYWKNYISTDNPVISQNPIWFRPTLL